MQPDTPDTPDASTRCHRLWLASSQAAPERQRPKPRSRVQPDAAYSATVLAYRNGHTFGYRTGYVAGARFGRRAWLASGVTLGFSAGVAAVLVLRWAGLA